MFLDLLHSCDCCRPLWRWSLENSCGASWCLPIQIPLYWLCEQNIPPKCWWVVSTWYVINQSLLFICFLVGGILCSMSFLHWSGLAIDLILLNLGPIYSSCHMKCLMSIALFFFFFVAVAWGFCIRGKWNFLKVFSHRDNLLLIGVCACMHHGWFCFVHFINCRSGSVCLDVINQSWSPMFGNSVIGCS